MTYRLGLTGSIGMGKSTTAAMFEAEGVPVWDADAAVHRLYAKGGAAVEPLRSLRPEAVIAGSVDRAAMKTWITTTPDALRRIEQIVHPLVAADREAFAQSASGGLALFDIPLLFETGADREMDAVVVVTAPPEIQRARVLARPGTDERAFEMILSKQMPDAEKRRRADFVIETTSLEAAWSGVQDVLTKVRQGMRDA